MSERSEQKPLSAPLESNETAFSINEINVKMRSYLKIKHSLPKPSVDFLSSKFKSLAKKDREDKSLGAVFRELGEVVRKARGDLSPTYLALIDFMSSPELGLNQESQGSTTEVSDVVEKTAVASVAKETAAAAEVIFKNEEGSSVRGRLPSIMDMKAEDVLPALFPDVSGVVLETFNLKLELKLSQGPAPEEADNPYWKVQLISNLLHESEPLRADLEKRGISIDSIARMLHTRRQLDESKDESMRSERSRRKLDTMVGVNVADLQMHIAKEKVIAGRSLREGGGEAPLRDDGAVPQDAVIAKEKDPVDQLFDQNAAAPVEVKIQDLPQAEVQGGDVDDIHSRPTIPPDELPDAAHPMKRETMIDEHERIGAAALQNNIPTLPVPIDAKEVREHLRNAMPTAYGMDASMVAAEVEAAKERAAEPTQPTTQRSPEEASPAGGDKPVKPKKKRGVISRILSGGDKDKE